MNNFWNKLEQFLQKNEQKLILLNKYWLGFLVLVAVGIFIKINFRLNNTKEVFQCQNYCEDKGYNYRYDADQCYCELEVKEDL